MRERVERALLSTAERFRSARTSTGARGWLFAVAAALFLAVAVLSYLRLPHDRITFVPLFVVVLLVAGTPAMVGVLAVEFRLMANLLGLQATGSEAVRVSVLSAAANLLPLPGSVLVRAGYLRTGGAGARDIGLVVLSIGLATVSIATGLAGTGLLAAGSMVWGAALTATAGIGALLTLLVVRLVRGGQGDALRWTVRLLVVELGLVAVMAGRLWLALRALNVDVALAAPLVLTVASVITTSLGILPGGLGIRELAMGVMSPIAALDPAVGTFAGAIDRVAFLLGLAITSAGVMVRGGSVILERWSSGEAPQDTDSVAN